MTSHRLPAAAFGADHADKVVDRVTPAVAVHMTAKVVGHLAWLAAAGWGFGADELGEARRAATRRHVLWLRAHRAATRAAAEEQPSPWIDMQVRSEVYAA